ncbi:uncharacterized protein LOC129721495 [Wyeomyia smithii]|uniref:uncharacterized protein LOC129721495 n=1 Tax=Wyeomyia smithii TaxID=174621 RepID=UPI002467D8AB|nr:uncharacterized protein LOC129721495 [Wyeomyia smithii]
MNFNVFSVLNITSLLSEYLGSLSLPSFLSGLKLYDSPAATLGEDEDDAVAGSLSTTTDNLSLQQRQYLNLNILANFWCLLKETAELLWEQTVSFGSLLEFTDFQLLIGKTFLIILFVNLLLIAFYWRKYGSIITDRFIRPSTAKEIEELKLSVARLKLPKEHSPRI